MAAFEPWAVVKAPFPYSNQAVTQRRPALVLASLPDTGGPALLWVAMVTSAAHRRWVSDLDVSDLATAGLPAPSMVRLAKVATSEADHAEPLGVLAERERAAIRVQLRGLLAILR